MAPSTQVNIADGTTGTVIQAGDIHGDLVIADGEATIPAP